jgi:hypothetical protein
MTWVTVKELRCYRSAILLDAPEVKGIAVVAEDSDSTRDKLKYHESDYHGDEEDHR